MGQLYLLHLATCGCVQLSHSRYSVAVAVPNYYVLCSKWCV